MKFSSNKGKTQYTNVGIATELMIVYSEYPRLCLRKIIQNDVLGNNPLPRSAEMESVFGLTAAN